MMKTVNRIMWGLVLVALGVLFGLHQLELLPFTLFFKGWWTLFIIVPSIISLLTEPNKTGSFIGLLLGVFLLLCSWDIVPFSLLWKLALPILIILIGLKLVFGKKNASAAQNSPAADGTKATPRGVAVFSGHELRFSGKVFNGLEAVAVFGGVDCFAADALIQQDCFIRATAVFGGVDLHLPPTVNVQVVSNGLFGGVENHRAQAPTEGIPTVYVHCTTVFGGVEIL